MRFFNPSYPKIRSKFFFSLLFEAASNLLAMPAGLEETMAAEELNGVEVEPFVYQIDRPTVELLTDVFVTGVTAIACFTGTTAAVEVLTDFVVVAASFLRGVVVVIAVVVTVDFLDTTSSAFLVGRREAATASIFFGFSLVLEVAAVSLLEREFYFLSDFSEEATTFFFLLSIAVLIDVGAEATVFKTDFFFLLSTILDFSTVTMALTSSAFTFVCLTGLADTVFFEIAFVLGRGLCSTFLGSSATGDAPAYLLLDFFGNIFALLSICFYFDTCLGVVVLAFDCGSFLVDEVSLGLEIRVIRCWLVVAFLIEADSFSIALMKSVVLEPLEELFYVTDAEIEVVVGTTFVLLFSFFD